MRSASTRAVAAIAVVSASAVAAVALAGAGQAQVNPPQAYGITANGKQLLTFRVDRPQVVDWFRNVTGLVGNDKSLIGLDFRVQDGKLYGVGNAGGIYTISIPGAVLTKVSQLTVACRATLSASTSTPPPTGCGSSATPARTSGTTSTTAPRSPIPRSTHRPRPTPPRA
ncbi:DUF4394 domain-containing protein [Actinokineospora auranticolor]|uniref:DUF4394 domain-containing protein n=1 Tax=Actinokineospora auranticolor TaxID=155976 RepID=UPI0035A957D3